MDGWNTIVSFWGVWASFSRCKLAVSFREGFIVTRTSKGVDLQRLEGSKSGSIEDAVIFRMDWICGHLAGRKIFETKIARNRSPWRAKVADRSWLDGVQCGYFQDFVEVSTSNCTRCKLRSNELLGDFVSCKFSNHLKPILESHHIIIFDDQFLPNNRAMKPSTNLSGPNPSECLECFDFVSPTKIEFLKKLWVFTDKHKGFFIRVDVGTTDFCHENHEMMIFWCYQKRGSKFPRWECFLQVIWPQWITPGF